MDKASFEKWQALQDEFLNGELGEKEFCKAKNLDLSWFRKQLSEAEQYEKRSENLFVELVPQLDAPTAACLNVRFREVAFELADGFPVEVFRQALQVVREVL